VIFWVNLRKPHGEVAASVFRDSSLERDKPSFAGRKCRLCGWMRLTFHRPYQDPRKPFTVADDVVEHPVAVAVLEYHVMLMLIISRMPQVEIGEALRASFARVRFSFEASLNARLAVSAGNFVGGDEMCVCGGILTAN